MYSSQSKTFRNVQKSKISMTDFSLCMYECQVNIVIFLDFSLTVKVATLIFISGCGSAILSAKEGKSGLLFLAMPQGCLQFVIVVFPDHTHLLFFIYNLVKS